VAGELLLPVKVVSAITFLSRLLTFMLGGVVMESGVSY
jgi:hypothetical protein